MERVGQTTVLGKRRTRHEDLVLHLKSSPSSTVHVRECPDYKFTGKSSYMIVNGSLVPKTKKCYHCTFPTCDKSYAKPSRLEEHERSHTGDRPFVCATCSKSYLRETHLHAHTRSHLPESMKPFVCERTNCSKRFWTSQHLQVHHSWHDGAKPYKCTEIDCHEAYAKHHQLRVHICAAHAPPGSKPFRCEHTDCTKSFDTDQHLKTHCKTHDPNRYTCVHISCLTGPDRAPIFFQTWSALQSHIKKLHPPTCPHPLCKGRIFANQGNLRAHLKLHEEKEVEMVVDAAVQARDMDNGPSRKKRRGGEQGRDWKCETPKCDKEFKSKRALAIHIKVTHLGQRDFSCDHPNCGRSFGYKHLLQRHQAVHLGEPGFPEDDSEAEAEFPGAITSAAVDFNIDTITGHSYVKRAEALLHSSKALRCPFSQLGNMIVDPETIAASTSLRPPPISNCEYVFTRAYDLRRHLASTHDIMVEKERVDEWLMSQRPRF